MDDNPIDIFQKTTPEAAKTFYGLIEWIIASKGLGKPPGLWLVPCMIVFCIIMDIPIGWLIIAKKRRGLKTIIQL